MLLTIIDLLRFTLVPGVFFPEFNKLPLTDYFCYLYTIMKTALNE